ncbi:hypothetical protein RHMOL_Rhmol09G0230700 [Rhododendron molle]|uniref:Uncharacterized protein n=1 Tax=Rhododendron molle TaxID=49168 RepID=A0ACC0MI85_RHOML|nr:hypothetical protein RHMOL_Rhmol09G0230700 [Rhododendron molle]
MYSSSLPSPQPHPFPTQSSIASLLPRQPQRHLPRSRPSPPPPPQRRRRQISFRPVFQVPIPKPWPMYDSERPTLDKTMEFGYSFLEAAKPRFKDVLISSSSDWQKEDSRFAREPSNTCIIADSMMASFAVDVAGEAGIPIMCYHNACPSDLWAVLCVPKLIEAGEVPFQGSRTIILCAISNTQPLKDKTYKVTTTQPFLFFLSPIA